MNCKQGDRAMIVRLGSRSHYAGLDWKVANMILGHVVICARFYTNSTWPSWEFEEPINVATSGAVVIVTGIADECLVPLPDLDPEATTERTEELTV